MAQKRIRNGSVRWVGRYRDPAGKERSRTFDTKREATAWESEREREMRRGEWLDPDDENTTVGALAEEWQRGATRPNTVRSREALVNNLGDLHAMPVRAVRPSHIVDWHSTLIKGRPWKKGKPLAESSAAVMAGQLSGLLSRAAEDGIILRVPRFEPPKAPQRTVVNRADLLSPAQVAAMITAAEKKDQSHSPARPWLARMVLIAAGSGMRVSELGGLRVCDVDFLRGEIHVRKQSSPDGKSLVEVKSAASVRTIPVPQVVIDAVEEQLAESPRGRGESVWIRSNGLFHTRNSIGRALARMIELHGLRPATMHDLRHYYASSLIAAGVPVPGVQVALGHASSATTLNVYTHLWPGSEDVTRRAAEGALRDVTVVRDQCGTSDSNKGARAVD